MQVSRSWIRSGARRSAIEGRHPKRQLSHCAKHPPPESPIFKPCVLGSLLLGSQMHTRRLREAKERAPCHTASGSRGGRRGAGGRLGLGSPAPVLAYDQRRLLGLHSVCLLLLGVDRKAESCRSLMTLNLSGWPGYCCLPGALPSTGAPVPSSWRGSVAQCKGQGAGGARNSVLAEPAV